LRKTERRISAPRLRVVPAATPLTGPPVIDPAEFIDPRVARIISEIPQRRTREHTYGRPVVAAR